MNNANNWYGTVAIYYLGDGPGDKNLKEENPVRPVRLCFNKKGQSEMRFLIDYPGIPFFGEIRFNLVEFSTRYADLLVYRLDVIELNDDEFIIIMNYVWTFPTDLENFEVIARFKGKVPAVLKPRQCPAFNA